MTDDHLIIFVKAPRPGSVKTRLAQAIGPDAACSAYRQLVETLLSSLASLTNVELRFTPDDAGEEINLWLQNTWQKNPQGSGDLGVRMANAFADAFQRGFKRVVIVGSDCPDVEPADVRTGRSALQDHDLVLGPASDGGYWLIGLKRELRMLFEDIAWSSSEVFSQTLARAEAAKLRVKLLRELSDVDTDADWRAFRARMERISDAETADCAKSRPART